MFHAINVNVALQITKTCARPSAWFHTLYYGTEIQSKEEENLTCIRCWCCVCSCLQDPSRCPLRPDDSPSHCLLASDPPTAKHNKLSVQLIIILKVHTSSLSSL